MPRILSGEAKGRKLAAAKGAAVRPTGSRVRQTFFDILAPGIAGARVLDLCAGTGAVGLEALSREAGYVAFVEASAAAARLIQQNLRTLHTRPERAVVVRRDALAALAGFDRAGARFDIIFFDPPYDSDLYEPVLERLGEGAALSEGGLVVAEHFHKRPLPATIGPLVRSRQVRVGDHVLSFYLRKDEA